MDRFLENAMRQREWDDCYKYDYSPYPYYLGDDEEEGEDDGE